MALFANKLHSKYTKQDIRRLAIL